MADLNSVIDRLPEVSKKTKDSLLVLSVITRNKEVFNRTLQNYGLKLSSTYSLVVDQTHYNNVAVMYGKYPFKGSATLFRGRTRLAVIAEPELYEDLHSNDPSEHAATLKLGLITVAGILRVRPQDLVFQIK